MNLTELYVKLDEADILLYKAKNNEGELGKEYLQMAKEIIWSLKFKVEREMEEKKNESKGGETVQEEPSGTGDVEWKKEAPQGSILQHLLSFYHSSQQ